MDKKEQILHYHRIDGLSLREISRRVGLNRKTVTRYIREYEAQVSSDPEEGADMCLASRPKYPPRKVERSKLTDVVCAEIEYWLSENAKRRQTGMKKQCLKRQDIHRALIEKGGLQHQLFERVQVHPAAQGGEAEQAQGCVHQAVLRARRGV